MNYFGRKNAGLFFKNDLDQNRAQKLLSIRRYLVIQKYHMVAEKHWKEGPFNQQKALLLK